MTLVSFMAVAVVLFCFLGLGLSTGLNHQDGLLPLGFSVI